MFSNSKVTKLTATVERLESQLKAESRHRLECELECDAWKIKHATLEKGMADLQSECSEWQHKW